jgi:hypothetical protein
MHIGDIVQLKEDHESFYAHAQPEAEGIVKDKKVDDSGFDLIYVQWFDTEEDGWTFSSHFEVIDKDTDLISSFDNDEKNTVDLYMEEISDAFDDIADSEGFLTLSITRIKNPENGKVYLAPRLHTMTATKEASLAIEAQIVQMASEIYSNAVRNSLDFGD